MLRGNWRGHTLGSGSDAWKYWDEKRAGRIGDEEWNEIEGGISRSFGTCMVMGTAATMMAITEALGMALPGASSIPAPDANHPRMCAAAGRRAVEMVWEDLTPEKILTPEAFDNAIRVHMALGGSTNAIIHVIALARRAGIALDMARFDEISRQVPVIANITPSGKYLMEDFFYAGGLRALMVQMKDLLELSCLTVNGRSVGDNISGAGVHLPDVIHPLTQPLYPEGATAVLTGNLAPRGCVMKPAAAEQRLLRHRGKAIAFENYDHMAREVDRDDLEVTPDHVLVLKNGGPKGGPGMPEWGQLPIPKKLLKAGVRDMLRISDARMSGTSYGACILHVAPESFVGGPLAFVQTGDEIEVDVEARRIHLHVGDEEMARRRAAWQQPPPKYPRGYGAMFSEHIGQADEGCDFDFLAGTERIAEPEIH
jgi:dihydroxy-acid dehydratase